MRGASTGGHQLLFDLKLSFVRKWKCIKQKHSIKLNSQLKHPMFMNAPRKLKYMCSLWMEIIKNVTILIILLTIQIS